MNYTVLSGNITRDPEIRYLGDGVAVASFGLAVDRRYMNNATGEWESTTSFFDVSCWRELAENVVLSLRKGSRVIVSGRLEQKSWTGDDGRVRSRVELVADDIGASVKFNVLGSSELQTEDYTAF